MTRAEYLEVEVTQLTEALAVANNEVTQLRALLRENGVKRVAIVSGGKPAEDRGTGYLKARLGDSAMRPVAADAPTTTTPTTNAPAANTADNN